MARIRSNRGSEFLRRALRRRRDPLPRGAAVRLLIDGPQIIPAIEQACRTAKTQILIETYMIGSDDTGQSLLDILCDKAEDGIDVWVVFDAIGSIGLTAADRQRLIDHGVHLRIFNPVTLLAPLYNFFRTHRRIIVIDGKVGYIGGFGFTNEWMVEGFHGGPWYEFAWEVRGAPLRQMIATFSRDWRKHSPRQLPVTDAPENLPHWVMNKTHWRSRQMRNTLVRLLRRARRRVWICTPYFVPTLRLVAAIRAAAARGVEIHLYLPGAKADHKIVQYAGRRRYHVLLTAGVKIFECQDRMLHAKAGIIDDSIAIVGSSNLDNWSLHYNKELNLAVVSEPAVKDLATAMRVIESNSKQITLDEWQHRSIIDRFFESLFGIMDKFL